MVLRDIDNVGHYEVTIGIDDKENIILAEPGGALGGKVEFERISKNNFINRWQNMSRKLHGRLLIAPPNEQLALQVGNILHDIKHYFNDDKKNANSQILSKV